jgi:glutamate formiminotransferase / 5-formyltetrahydrofolate cyclo-ligase
MPRATVAKLLMALDSAPMNQLVECVPNFSEGRRVEVVDVLAQAVSATPGIQLLDRTSDADHNRSVLTFAGRPTDVSQAMESAVGIALERIDMRRHAGQHPRIGAVDVIPFVPLGEMKMGEAVALATDFGRHIAERFELPVYLYGRAATRPERERLADIRRPQYEGLTELIDTPGYRPDFGPAQLHPTGGAVAVGARPFLIAYNINLETDDVALAKSIARTVRESSGGLPRVQALGLYLDDLGCAQVSMNLLDFSVTPMWRVWREVEAAASAAGVALRESELIGLVPIAALLDVADHIGVAPELSETDRIGAAARWLRVRDFKPTMALELRVAAMADSAGGRPT